MDIQTRKIEFIQEFLKKRKVETSENSFEPMTIEELNKRIDKSEDDFINGNYKSSSQLLLKYL